MGLEVDQLERARSAASDLQQDAGTVVRRTRGTLNKATGKYPITEQRIYPPIVDPDDEDEATTAQARLKRLDSQVAEVDAQGQMLVHTQGVLSLPIPTSADVQKDDIFICAASKFDPDLVGREFRVRGPHNQTHATARRFLVEETS